MKSRLDDSFSLVAVAPPLPLLPAAFDGAMVVDATVDKFDFFISTVVVTAIMVAAFDVCARTVFL